MQCARAIVRNVMAPCALDRQARAASRRYSSPVGCFRELCARRSFFTPNTNYIASSHISKHAISQCAASREGRGRNAELARPCCLGGYNQGKRRRAGSSSRAAPENKAASGAKRRWIPLSSWARQIKRRPHEPPFARDQR